MTEPGFGAAAMGVIPGAGICRTLVKGVVAVFRVLGMGVVTGGARGVGILWRDFSPVGVCVKAEDSRVVLDMGVDVGVTIVWDWDCLFVPGTGLPCAHSPS